MRSRLKVLIKWFVFLVILYLATIPVTVSLLNSLGRSDVSCTLECTVDEDDSDPFADGNFDDGLSKKKRITFVRQQIASTVTIYTDNYTREKGLQDVGGTGVIIDDDGTVLTAWHVVDDAEFIQVAFQKLLKDDATVDETRYIPMYVDMYDRSIDSAILKPLREEEGLPPPISLDTEWSPKLDDLLWHFGSTTMWSQGRVKDTRFLHLLLPIKARCVTVAMDSDYGDSGGPVVTPEGSLVGIVLSLSITGKDRAHYMPISTIVETLALTCH